MSNRKRGKAPAVAEIGVKRKYEAVFDVNVSKKIEADASSKLQSEELAQFMRSLTEAIATIRTAHDDSAEVQEAYCKFRRLQVEAEFMVDIEPPLSLWFPFPPVTPPGRLSSSLDWAPTTFFGPFSSPDSPSGFLRKHFSQDVVSKTVDFSTAHLKVFLHSPLVMFRFNLT